MNIQNNMPKEVEGENGLELLVKHLAQSASPENISYEMQSHRGKVVEVPKNYAQIAGAIVNHVITGKEKSEIVILLPYFIGNPGMLQAFARLADSTKGQSVYGEPGFSNRALRSQDELYLKVCIDLNQYRARTSQRELAKELHELLVDAVEDLKT